ncbi:MAG: class I SAM-dependent methyltransferase [Acetobacteraceae bacterium]|nr:class I SAM-dependent methyltransferase [Acetobacteraceae bacterium]MBV8521199.1 class I SAM-dependent methyltransferase [Acetobacteraceae bacterium]
MNRDNLDQNVDEYLNPIPERQLDQRICSIIAEYIIGRLEGPRILELGVGDQVYTPMLVQRFGDVTSVDGSGILLQRMATTLGSAAAGRWTPVLSYFEEYEPSVPFDNILATNILEHVEDPVVVLSRCRDWLRPGGCAHIAVPNAGSLHRRLAVKMGLMQHVSQLGETDHRMGHKHCFSWIDLERYLVAAGFHIEHRQGLWAKLLPNAMLVNCSEAQLRGMVELGMELPIDYAAVTYMVARVR